MVSKFNKNGLNHISIENDYIKAIFLPSIGGKMIQLINKKTGNQFLLDNQTNDHVYLPAYHGADFSKFDTSGFDECFPTIAPVDFEISENNNKRKISFPDHGEVWSKPWIYNIEDDLLILSVSGVNANYDLSKKITLDKNHIKINYSLKNKSDKKFNFIWSAHPLLKISEGSQLILPENINKVFLNWSSDNEIGNFGDYLDWPYLFNNGKKINFSEVQSEKINFAFKGFTEILNEGYAGLYNKEFDESILFTFDNNKTPYIGIWLCYGGWPEDSENKHYTIGLEPANGRPDSLEEAIKRNEFVFCEGNSEVNWDLDLSIWPGMPNVKNVLKSFSLNVI